MGPRYKAWGECWCCMVFDLNDILIRQVIYTFETALNPQSGCAR